MPIVTVELVSGRTVEQKRAVAKAITEAVVEHLKTSPESVTVIFRDASRENIATAGVLFSDR